MKRRSFCQYVAMGSACFAGVVGPDLTFAMSSAFSQTKSRHKWVVLYWMPYDNDLARFGEPIVEMLTRGTQNPEIAVVVQSDYWRDPQMRRRQIIDGTITEVDVLGEDRTYHYFGEQYCDALVLLSWLSRIGNQRQNEFAEFAGFLRSSVITLYKTGGELYGGRSHSNTDSEELCGLSLYLPETEQDISRYSSLALYQGVDLVRVYRGIVTS
jgi:hypothetical protein